MDPIELRPFRDEDAADVVGWAADPDDARRWAGLRAPATRADFRRWHADPDVLAFVLCDARRPVAYGEVWVDEAEQEVELARLLVDPARRGRGLGARLVEALLARAAAFGLPAAFVRVVPDNGAAIRCYERAGFRRLPRREEERCNRSQPLAYVWLRRPFA